MHSDDRCDIICLAVLMLLCFLCCFLLFIILSLTDNKLRNVYYAYTNNKLTKLYLVFVMMTMIIVPPKLVEYSQD